MVDDAKGQTSNAIKDPDDWTTGDETMTGAQASISRPCATRLAKNSIRR